MPELNRSSPYIMRTAVRYPWIFWNTQWGDGEITGKIGKLWFAGMHQMRILKRLRKANLEKSFIGQRSIKKNLFCDRLSVSRYLLAFLNSAYDTCSFFRIAAKQKLLHVENDITAQQKTEIISLKEWVCFSNINCSLYKVEFTGKCDLCGGLSWVSTVFFLDRIIHQWRPRNYCLC